ncbi:MAG: carboxypeptidase-like regulatory domain-containing protein [Prevotella sp.]|nr:carboxypeptidase-like regulatory domain-containing protein [Prevotella sp.]
MKIIRPLLLLLITAVVSQAFAQRRLVVVDVETLVPVIGANVVSADGNTTTDSLGYFSVSDSCRSLAFSHVNYEPRMINLTEVRDTVYLISKLLNVREVVVFGHGPHDVLPEALKKQLKINKTEAELAAANPGGANLLPLLARLIPKKWRKNKKEERMKRLRQILEAY